MARKIFPYKVGNHPDSSFTILFVAEGFDASEEGIFTAHCVHFIDELLHTTPFSLTHLRPEWLTIYTLFTASENKGPAMNVPAEEGRTVLESALVDDTLTVNAEKVNKLIESSKLEVEGEELPLSYFFAKGVVAQGVTGGLIVVLLPSLGGNGAEAEHIPGSKDFAGVAHTNDDGEWVGEEIPLWYYFVATTADGLWPQVVFRGIASCLGLGNEYTLEGDKYKWPLETDGPYIPPFNLDHFEETPSLSDSSTLKWSHLLSATQQQESPDIHPNDNLNTPDWNIPSAPIRPKKVGYYEGGNGYRKKVYRSAEDCLMRRKIGHSVLKVRDKPVPFCRVCHQFIKNVIY